MSSETTKNTIEFEAQVNFKRHSTRRDYFLFPNTKKSETKNNSSDPPKTLEEINEEAEKERAEKLSKVKKDLMMLDFMTMFIPGGPLASLSISLLKKVLEEPSELKLKEEIEEELANHIATGLIEGIKNN